MTCPLEGDNLRKLKLRPHKALKVELEGESEQIFGSDLAEGGARDPLASWRGNGPPRLRWVAGLRGRTATLELRHGPDSYGRQQWGILGNGRKPDPATPRGGRRPSGRKLLSEGKKKMTVPLEEAPANSVPAAAVRRGGRALFGITGRKGRVGGLGSFG